MTELSIGILVDSALKHQCLSDTVVQAGHTIAVAHLLSQAMPLPTLEQAVDAWLVDVSLPDEDSAGDQQQALLLWMDELLVQSKVPVLVNDDVELVQGSAEYTDWLRRILQRLQRLNGDINLQAGRGASEVWVLGASTGGPAAVKDFLQQLPANLQVAFLYVQHIDSGQAQTLVNMMTKAGHYPVRMATHGLVLANNTITLISADCSVNIHANGTLLLNQQAWGGCYAPSIDQVAANVARVYRQRSGLIVFSGMGDDGARSSRLIKQQGGKVWVQSPAQCTIASMPEATLATGTVSFMGTPPELAKALASVKAPTGTSSAFRHKRFTPH